MLRSFCRSLFHLNGKHPTLAFLLQNPHLRSFSYSSDSASLTLSYLINSCGLSPESALQASKRINFKSTQVPDSVLEFFKARGFSNTQITNLISARPRLLLVDVDTTLKPVLTYFQDLGLSDSEITYLISSNPPLLLRGLNTQIIPSIEFLRNLVQTNENVIKVFRRYRWMFTCNLQKRMQPNVALLREYQLPDSRITNMVLIEPRILSMSTELLKEILKRVEDLGLEPGSMLFVKAIHAMCSMEKPTWEAKFELLKTLGWSENEFLDALRRMPLFMKCSEKKIRMGMDFFVNKLKWMPSEVARDPILLLFSLKRWLIPRSKVWKILKWQELVSEGELKRMLMLNENDFLSKYVIRYDKEVPHLLKAYKGELGFKWLDGKGEGEHFGGIQRPSHCIPE